ncbi:DUF6745 domain-containing protein [Hymenobacter cellulosilyticus]|uniref:DUF6745 domain-containing protein n=1 Tax=Hymenobacter cellulosilyticus TaxID=2932248 RepID=A0A8T9QA51_9BACT|nr:hypothetical protein [Hymenobacter cellulosilyticus]UOQ73008.1 hypothetical protein MUN79_03240 [Hymenobacter cellulosilyticus]
MFSINARGRHLRRPAPAAPEPAAPAAPVPPTPSIASEPTAAYARAAGVVRTTPEEARALLLSGRMPDELIVSGALRLNGEPRLRELPTFLECTHLEVNNCPNLELFPERLRATSVQATRTGIRELTGDWLVRETVNLSDNPRLQRLPERLTAKSLSVANCPQLLHLPATLHLTNWVEVAGSGLTSLPSGLKVNIRWQGTAVDERTAFRPEDLKAVEILNVRNVTRRRVLLERFGLDRFIEEVGGLIIDRDRDAGGERQLLSIPLEDDEPIVALRVKCPSTAHSYVLRVPPHVRTCRRAAAWLAGFENEHDYRPLIET